MNRLIKISVLLLIIVAVLVQGANIYISSRRDLDSLSATDLRGKIENLEETNTILEAKILRLAAFTTVASRAAEIGFKDTKDFVSLYDPVEVAIRR